ncbi:putative aldehyde reductase [Zopfochytrium polystomum]|nr:putative aldehyde reductase [Zopfochytrium polystomum]
MTTTTTTTSPTTNGLKIVFGAAGQLWNNPDNVPAVLKLLADAGIRNIDSARRYGPSEKIIGDHAVAATLTVDTKHPGGMQVPGGATKESILEVAAVSFDLLKTEQVDIYYLHAPDRKTPIADTLAGIDELHKQGRFRRFGLSNYLPTKSRRSSASRRSTATCSRPSTKATTLRSRAGRRPSCSPVLRRHGIAFYAYSPTAGGFLTKTRAAIESETAGGRFEKGAGVVADMYRSMWIVYHSALRAELGDAVILGARTLEQLQGTIDGLRAGPLPEAVAQRVDAIWEQLKEHAVLDNFNDFIGAK